MTIEDDEEEPEPPVVKPLPVPWNILFPFQVKPAFPFGLPLPRLFGVGPLLFPRENDPVNVNCPPPPLGEEPFPFDEFPCRLATVWLRYMLPGGLFRSLLPLK